jgi:hypothetical protein
MTSPQITIEVSVYNLLKMTKMPLIIFFKNKNKNPQKGCLEIFQRKLNDNYKGLVINCMVIKNLGEHYKFQ